MNRDFHYDVISVVAQAAGFPLDEATLIAHASQYTDDCTFYEPMAMSLDRPGVQSPEDLYDGWEDTLRTFFPTAGFKPFRKYAFRKGPLAFDPICTAYFNLEKRLKSLLKSPVALFKELGRLKQESSMLKVFVAFHFVPDHDLSRPRKKFYVERDCRFLREYIDALLQILDGRPVGAPGRRQALIALGIALHSFADTWAHEGFSGRWDSQDNDIEDLKVARQYGDQEMGVMPDIGHLEAGAWVDRAEADLKFVFCQKNGKRKKDVARQNPVHFTQAADYIFQLLSRGRPFPADVKKFLFDAFRMDLSESERIAWMEHRVNVAHTLQTSYPNMKVVSYDRQQWLNEIVPAPSDYGALIAYEYKPDADWFLFQTAALAQRNLVHAHVS